MQLFETRIAVAEIGRDKQDLAALMQVRPSSKAASPPSRGLFMRSRKVREKRAVEKDGVIDSFADHTLAILRDQIAPLMQWRDPEKEIATGLIYSLLAYNRQNFRPPSSRTIGTFDLLDLCLPINVKQVEEKLPLINKAKELSFYEKGTVETFEELRKELRGIAHFVPRNVDREIKPQPTLKRRRCRSSHGRTSCKTRRTRSHPLPQPCGIRPSQNDRKERTYEKSMDGPTLARARCYRLVQQVRIEIDINLEDLLVHFPNKSAIIEWQFAKSLDSLRKDRAIIGNLSGQTSRAQCQPTSLSDLIKNYLSSGSVDRARGRSFHLRLLRRYRWRIPQDDQIEDLLGLVREISATPN